MRIHKITRRNFMKVAGVSALAMGLAACGGSSSSTAASTSTAASASTAAGGEVTGDKVVINIGHINDESDSWHQGALKFKEYCEANSNGTIEVDVFPNSQLGPEVDMIQGILSDSLHRRVHADLPARSGHDRHAVPDPERRADGEGSDR